MLRKSSIWCKLFSKGHILVKNSIFLKNHEKKKKSIEGGVPALRVIRAGTRLTVHRSLPYQNSIELGQSGAAHADAHEHGKVVFVNKVIDKWSW